MMNYWWMTRPKRKLNSIPEVLATFSEISLNQEWEGQRDTHLTLEDALEHAGLKRTGERRDQTGGGARTYRAWLESLGLIFVQESTNKIMLTLAGEAIMNGDSPVAVLKNQVLKYQFPSAFSLKRNIDVAGRFKIRPFRFLLKLLMDDRLLFLTQDEIAKIIVVEAENETDACYEFIVNRILQYRHYGAECLSEGYPDTYGTTESNLNDLANTIINWLDYTQLIERAEQGRVVIGEDKKAEVEQILSTTPPFIDRPHQQEYFQRKYGVDPKHNKDTRNLTNTHTITAKIIAENKIRQAYIAASLKQPITKITSELIDTIAEKTGIKEELIEETLQKLYPHGSVGSFMTEYREMAFKGREEATDFEKATVLLFKDIFGFDSRHVGPIGLTPDVLILSDSDGYQAIIDNKAYHKYTISNDHRNRMITNYINGLHNYSDSSAPLAFFSYIAGGFGTTFDTQLQAIVRDTGVNGSGMSVDNMIRLVECYKDKGYTHQTIKDLFSVNRQVRLSDFT